MILRKHGGFTPSEKVHPVRENSLTGFTIMEALIVIVVASIISIGAFTFYLNQQRSSIIEQKKAQLQRTLRLAMNAMIEDIRTAGYDPLDSGNFGLTISEASRIGYTVDKDEDGVVDSDEEHRFKLDGTTLKYTKDGTSTWRDINPSNVAVEFTSLQFTYPSDKVEIELTGRIEIASGYEDYETQTLTTEVALTHKIIYE